MSMGKGTGEADELAQRGQLSLGQEEEGPSIVVLITLYGWGGGGHCRGPSQSGQRPAAPGCRGVVNQTPHLCYLRCSLINIISAHTETSSVLSFVGDGHPQLTQCWCVTLAAQDRLLSVGRRHQCKFSIILHMAQHTNPAWPL